ncbi:hypothetical protein OJAV_G00053730 [Oryzias javanicus]|uniref:CCHC-type domain-containing protein n=1 Tax=Oryzias javanicus TaxID=123683 RepID=A0A3S2PEH0_ORYJA|nr:hypothetical protein OJAV_G00053730 [Oryzias javanicus]
MNTQIEADIERQRPAKGKERVPCSFCQDLQHRLHGCPKFIAKTLDERRGFIKEQKLCYGCTKPGHNAKDCRHRHSCDTCKGKHPTCLHDDNYVRKARVSTQEDATPRIAVQTEAAATSMSVATGQSTNTSMIVPVWISRIDEETEKLVYALLDTQSDTTFVDQDLSNALKAESCPVKLRLTTMVGRDMTVKSQRVSGLRVRGYFSSFYINLPHVYTKDCIPVNRAHIPTNETARKWNHLSKIVDEIPPLQDCEVGLLIGYNCARAMAPREVISGGNEEPYAVRTDLGWSIVGCSSPCLDTPSVGRHCFRIIVKELPPVTPADAIRVLESDFRDGKEDERTVSQEDIQFLERLKNGICKNSQGHYEMPLPFKERPILPDNKQLAVIRLSHLKKKLSRDEKYKEQLHKFVSNNRAVLESIPPLERASDITNINLTSDDLPSERALGIQWHVNTDFLKFSVNLQDQPATRRGILSVVASLYDPLGFVAPFLLGGKGVLQEMCRHGTDWDEPLTDELRPRWERWKRDLINMEKLSIPRTYTPADFGEITKRELHHFSDASTTGYGQCSYLRLINDKQEIHCALVMAKSRVAPIKVTTIPRLELTAAVVSVKTSNVLREELGYTDIEEYFWTDSKHLAGRRTDSQ